MTRPRIREEGIYSLERPNLYTSNSGLKELKIEICNYLNRRFGWQYDYEHETLVTVGGSEAIDLAFRAMIDKVMRYLYLSPAMSYHPCTPLPEALLSSILRRK